MHGVDFDLEKWLIEGSSVNGVWHTNVAETHLAWEGRTCNMGVTLTSIPSPPPHPSSSFYFFSYCFSSTSSPLFVLLLRLLLSFVVVGVVIIVLVLHLFFAPFPLFFSPLYTVLFPPPNCFSSSSFSSYSCSFSLSGVSSSSFVSSPSFSFSTSSYSYCYSSFSSLLLLDPTHLHTCLIITRNTWSHTPQ